MCWNVLEKAKSLSNLQWWYILQCQTLLFATFSQHAVSHSRQNTSPADGPLEGIYTIGTMCSPDSIITTRISPHSQNKTGWLGISDTYTLYNMCVYIYIYSNYFITEACFLVGTSKTWQTRYFFIQWRSRARHGRLLPEDDRWSWAAWTSAVLDFCRYQHDGVIVFCRLECAQQINMRPGNCPIFWTWFCFMKHMQAGFTT